MSLTSMAEDFIANYKEENAKKFDSVDHPQHYTTHPSGVECIQITEHMNFCLGNAVKYIWRADLKGDALEDLEKARWYIDREIQRRKEILKKTEKKKENRNEK